MEIRFFYPPLSCTHFDRPVPLSFGLPERKLPDFWLVNVFPLWLGVPETSILRRQSYRVKTAEKVVLIFGDD